MAVDFGNTIIEGGIEPSAKVQNPVADNSGAILAEGFAPAAKAVGQIAGSIFKGGIDAQNTQIVTNYENDLLDLADAVDQGLSRNEAMIKARNLRRQYLANAPALQADFDKVWSKFADSNGLGHVVVEGTVEQQANDALTKDAISKGYTPDQYKLFLSRANEAAAINQQIDMLKAQGGVITETERLKSIKAVTGLAQSAYPSAQRQINNAMAQISANPNNKAEIAANLNSVLGGSIAQLEYLSGNAEDTAYITTPIKTLMSTFNDWVSGKVTNEVMDGQIKATQNQYDLMYQSDPTLGPVIAQSKLLNSLGLNNSNIAVNAWTPEALQRLKQISDPNANLNILDNTEGSARFVDNIKKVAGSITPNSDPELVKEVSDSLNKMVDGAYVNERTAGGALGFKDTVETLGSPEIGSFLAQHGGISAKYKDQFVGVLKSNYENELLPVIDQAWNNDVPLPSRISMGNMGVGSIKTLPMNELIEPRWNGNAVEFVPKAEYAKDADVIRIARDATTGDNSIGVPLNNLINAYANVTGTDAKQIYEQDFANRLFGIGEESVADKANKMLDDTQTVEDNGLDISQFNPDELVAPSNPSEDTQSIISNYADDSGFVDPKDNPEVNSEALASFGSRLPVSVRNNNMGAISITGDINSSFAAKQPGFVGVTKRPANEGGYYARYATPENGVAAASKLLELYGRQGVDTPAAIVRKWSTDKSAHNAYANTLVKYLKAAGYDVTSSSNVDLSDPNVRMAILKAKSAHESGAGVPVYQDSVFIKGVNYNA